MNIYDKLGFYVLFAIGSIFPFTLAIFGFFGGYYLVSVACFYLAYTQLISFSKFYDSAQQFREIRKMIAEIKVELSNSPKATATVKKKVNNIVENKLEPLCKDIGGRMPSYLQPKFHKGKVNLSMN